MKEGVFPMEEIYPEIRKEEGFVQGKYFVVHTHIGSGFDHLVREHDHGEVIAGLPGSPGDLRKWGLRETLDASKHDVVNNNPQHNQAQNIRCELLVA